MFLRLQIISIIECAFAVMPKQKCYEERIRENNA